MRTLGRLRDLVAFGVLLREDFEFFDTFEFLPFFFPFEEDLLDVDFEEADFLEDFDWEVLAFALFVAPSAETGYDAAKTKTKRKKNRGNIRRRFLYFMDM